MFTLIFVLICVEYASSYCYPSAYGIRWGSDCVNDCDPISRHGRFSEVLKVQSACRSPTGSITEFNNAFSDADMVNLGIISYGRAAMVGTPLASFSWLIPIGLNLITGLIGSSSSTDDLRKVFNDFFDQLVDCMDEKIFEHRKGDIETEWYKMASMCEGALERVMNNDSAVIQDGHHQLSDLFDNMNGELKEGYFSKKLDNHQYFEAQALLPVFKVATELYWLTATTHLQILKEKAMAGESVGVLFNLDLDETRERLEILKNWCNNAMDILKIAYKPTTTFKATEFNLYADYSITWEGNKRTYLCPVFYNPDTDFAGRINKEYQAFINALKSEYKPLIDALWRNSWLTRYHGEITYHPVTRLGEWFVCETILAVNDVSVDFIIKECNANEECIGFRWSDEHEDAVLMKDGNCELNGIYIDTSPYISIWKSTTPLCYEKAASGRYPGCPHDAPDLARWCGDNEIDLRVQCDKHNDCIGYIWDLSSSFGCLRSAEGCTSYGTRMPTVYEYHIKCQENSIYASNQISGDEIIVGQLRSNDTCLDANADSDELYVLSRECVTDAVTQQWKYNLETKQMISMFDNKCLDLSKNSDDNGKIIMWDCHGGNNQKWLFDSKTGLKVVENKQCVTRSSCEYLVLSECMKPGSKFVTADCSDNDVLQWELIPVIDTTQRFTESVNTPCYDARGTDGSLSVIACKAGYQLVSCGIFQFGSASANINGSYIYGEACYAQIGGGSSAGEYVRAAARCCLLQGTPSCSSHSSSKGTSVDGFCANNETLTGCTVFSKWKGISGAFPRDDVIASDTDITDSFTEFHFLSKCTTSAEFGVWARARCCGNSDNRYNLKCGTIKSTKKSGTDRTARISCPAGYFLSGCSAYSSSTTAKAAAWYIEDDKCIAKAKEGSNVEDDSVWAVGICCQESYDPYYQPQCYTARGDSLNELTDHGRDIASATCIFGYQLVSCGISGSTSARIDGSFIENGICMARKTFDSFGVSDSEIVYAEAWCCKLHSSATCTSYRSVESGSSDDALVDAFCPNGQVLSGCTVDSEDATIDGAYPRDDRITGPQDISSTFSPFTISSQRCTAQNSGRYGTYVGVYANARCCSYGDIHNRYKLECGAIKSAASGSDFTATVKCPSGWMLTGCSGISAWKAAAMWYIEGEECIARARDDSSPNYGVWAVAICCKESYDASLYNPDLEPPYNPALHPLCYNVIGDPSDSTDDALSSATCPSDFQLVSCGTKGSTTGIIDGSFILYHGRCYAQMGGGASAGEYVRAVARCCTFEFDSACTPIISGYSDTHDDALVDAWCQNGETLAGCTVNTNWQNIDGAYPRDADISNSGDLTGTFSPFTPSSQRCTAQNAGSSSHGVKAHGLCCRSNDNRYKLECGAIKSPMSGADYRATVLCPSGWKMTGCSGLSYWRRSSMWYITDDEQCIARAKDGSPQNYGVWAVAICCKVIDTENPAKQIENEKILMDDGVHDSDAFSIYKGSPMRGVIISSLSGVFVVFFIIGLLAVVYYYKTTGYRSRYSVIEEQDTECEA